MTRFFMIALVAAFGFASATFAETKKQDDQTEIVDQAEDEIDEEAAE
jgi:hypothetical protein